MTTAKKWYRCSGCSQSCTGSYLGTPGCTRCGWYLGKPAPSDLMEDEHRDLLDVRRKYFERIHSQGHYISGRQLYAAKKRALMERHEQLYGPIRPDRQEDAA